MSLYASNPCPDCKNAESVLATTASALKTDKSLAEFLSGKTGGTDESECATHTIFSDGMRSDTVSLIDSIDVPHDSNEFAGVPQGSSKRTMFPDRVGIC